MNMGTNIDTSAFRLWQMISPSLPVGAYSYSQGLEQMIDTVQITDEKGIAGWIKGVLAYGLARTDLPVLLRVYHAARNGDDKAVLWWSRRLLAMRETAELRSEDLNMGGALLRLLPELGVSVPTAELPFAVAFALGAAAWDVDAADACAGYAWSWSEQQVAAAIKLVPLGHTAGQRLLLALGEQIESAVRVASGLGDEELGMSLPGFAIASARHETQYTRLFRS
jgi:urease accessory protein